MNIVIVFLCAPTVVSTVEFGTAFFSQNEYKISFDRAVVNYMHKAYVYNLRIINIKHNRTSKAFTLYYCVAHTLDGNQFKLNIKAHKLAFNVPKDLMLQFDVKVCDMLKNNVFGAKDMLKYGNSTECPLEKGCYKQADFSFDTTRFPPLIPPNSYRTDLSYYMGNVLIAQVYVYCELKYEVKKN